MNYCKCPYCGKHISYFTAFVIRRKGEYYCKKCKKESNVHIKKTIWILYFAVLVLALLVLGYFMFMTKRDNPFFVVLVILPFMLFYLFTPFFVRLSSKKKVQDSLYDTDMMNAPIIEPDPTMATSAATAPAFIDDLELNRHEEDSPINPDVFNAIKEERKVVADTDGGTKAFDKFENISSSGDDDIGSTRLVGDLKNR